MDVPKVAVCADDYALSRSISLAILDLAASGRISAVSCMTASPLWQELGPALKVHADKVDIGLHITLVDESPLTVLPHLAPRGRLPSISRLIALSYLGRIAKEEVEAEVQAQLDAFVGVMGGPPAHLDGHLHAHVLPGIRDVVMAAAGRISPRPWLRSTNENAAAILARPSPLKAAFVAALGARFDRDARARGFTLNGGFAGFYDFRMGNYAHLFARFLRAAGPDHLILCHPGQAGDATTWAAARAREYAFFQSSAYQALLPPDNVARLSQPRAG